MKEKSSWVLEALSLGGVWRLIRLSSGRDLEESDLSGASWWFQSTAELEEDALRRYKNGSTGWQLMKSQIRPLRAYVLIGVTASALQGLLGTVGRYMILRTIIRALQNGASKDVLAMLSLLFFLVALFEGICSVAARQMLAGNMTQALIARHNALMMKKVLQLALITKSSPPKLSTIYAADVPRLLGFVRYLSLLACGITSMIGGLAIVAIFLGISALVALICMLIVGALQQYFTRVAKRIEPDVISKRDDVLASVSRAIRASKAVKFYSWESQFASNIRALRAQHSLALIQYRVRLIASVSIGKSFPVVATVATLLTAAARNNGQIKAEDAFAAIAVFQTIRIGMIILPVAVVLVNTYVLIHNRIASFLNAEEDQGPLPSEKRVADSTHLIHIVDATWSVSDEFTLSIPKLNLTPGTFCCVVGKVGAGKSQLLRFLLGRTVGRTSSALEIDSDLGYAPQDTFISSATIEDNILLGRSRSEEALAKAVKIACLERDIQAMPNGLATMLGERGTTLSGGQQARLQVARAVYNDPRLLLLDASLAAVDAKVGRTMFDNLKSWVSDGQRSAVLVLSQVSLVPECHECILMDKGQLLAQAPAKELVKILESKVCANAVVDHQASHDQEDDFPSHLYTALKQYYDKNVVSPDTQSEEEAFYERVEADEIITYVEDDASTRSPVVIKQEEEEASQPKSQSTWRKVKGFTPSHKKVAEDLVKAERMERGAISRQVFWAWAKGVGYWRIVLITTFYLVAGLALFASDLILAQWTRAKSNYYRYMIAYSCVALFHLPCLVIGGIWGVYATSLAGIRMHGDIVWAVLRAPMSWFETRPSGRIISRFGSDFDVLDMEWAQMLDGFMTMVSLFGVLLVAMCIVVPLLLPPIALCCYGMVQALFAINEANRDLKRIANSCVAPCVSNAQEAEAGRVVALAHKASDFFILRMRERLDAQLAAFYASTSVMQAAYFNATIWSALISLCAALLVVLVPPKYSLVRNGAQPVALSYAIICPYFAAMASEILLTLSLYATSLERLWQYMPEGGNQIPAEPAHALPSDTSVLSLKWPQHGAVVFDNVALRYRPGLPLSLTSVSFKLSPGSKNACCGRTGAGKSSILVAIFRLVDLDQGSINIDGIDISTLGLTALRKRLTLIPQEATLMQGTAKFNCDPFSEFSDDAVADALETVGLSRSLLHQDIVDQDGDGESSSLSTGQAQLLALCRAILRKSKVCCLDEATAHIDAHADDHIQRMVSREFQDSTLLTIAHRLHTIISYDKVIVMEDGRVAAFDEPYALLQDTDSHFYSMCSALGPAALKQLTTLAEAASIERRHKKSEQK